MSLITNYFNTLYVRWKELFSVKSYRNHFIFTIIFYIFLFKYCRIIVSNLEVRHGKLLSDWLLNHLPPTDLSMLTFSLTYIALITFILSTILHPKIFVVALQAYCLLIIMRTISIYLVPLEPPIGMILLRDPVTIIFMSTPSGGYIVKDLFFSGHVSTVVLFFIVAVNKHVKTLLLVLAFLIATFILLQHVHYTIDIIAAPFFSFLAFKLSVLMNQYIHKEEAAAFLVKHKSKELFTEQQM